MTASVSNAAAAIASVVLSSSTSTLPPPVSGGGLGALDEARRSHPAVFVPRNVLEYTVGGVPGYVFGGEAVQLFKGPLAPSDAKLYREAELDAKRNLLAFLSKGDKTKTVQMSGARKLYEYSEGNARRVVMFAAKDRISVSENPVPAVEKSDEAVDKPVAIEDKIEPVD